MFTILGLLGALFAGVTADAILSTKNQSDEDDGGDLPPEVEETLEDSGNLLDEFEDDPTGGPDQSPVSDDIEDPVEAGRDITGGAADDILSGGSGGDLVRGLDGSDLLDGRDGDDTIDGGAGNDAVWAGAGDDFLDVGTGNDNVEGQAGNDTIFGGIGNDSLAGHDGDDSLLGDDGRDVLLGGMGNDLLDGGTGNDALVAGAGDDRLLGGDGTDEVDGGTGDDWLSGLQGEVDDFDTDFLNGGAGNDTLVIGSGDYANGGEGDDDFVLQEWLTEGGVAHIDDYDVTQDQLIIIYDPVAHADPVLTLEVDAQGTQSTILLDGAPVATVKGSPVVLTDIRLTAA